MKNTYRRPGLRRLRRTREALGTGAVAAVASVVALGGLAVWTAAGYAGSPARIEVRESRVLLPVIAGRKTNAYFRIVNTGGAPDRLRSVSSRSVVSDIELTVHRMNTRSGAYRERRGAVGVPAYGEVVMSPYGTAVTLPAGETWRPGDRIAFTLDFERTGRVTVDAVVRPVTLGSGSAP
ncbi:copper chaperone PCu(A)C [Streptomyces sp. NPDC088729]|uniref:copper chaperone PCu(A)C n=1 Tax=Streptomyces sp. NPDC088729 TaxID=3365876 RepID=UPI0037F8747B